MIRFEGVRVRVPVPGGAKTLLDDVNLTIAERRVSVIGANGSGKSTLLRLVNGLLVATTGAVRVDGLDPAAAGAKVRRRVGFVFSDALSQLVMSTPVEDVELSLRRVEPDRRRRRERALALLAERGLGAVAHQSVYDLSGGERQLVALTAVLATEPAIVVADEPTTLLDLRNRLLVTTTLGALGQQLVYATHDLEFAAEAERCILVADGRIAADGAPDAVIARYRAAVRAGS